MPEAEAAKEEWHRKCSPRLRGRDRESERERCERKILPHDMLELAQIRGSLVHGARVHVTETVPTPAILGIRARHETSRGFSAADTRSCESRRSRAWQGRETRSIPHA